MAAVNFFDNFETLWAQAGALEVIDENQYKAGWAYIGATPPSVEQFNKVQQLSDQKAAWLFAQIKELAEQGGFELTADMVDALTKGVTALAPGRLLRTTVYTKVGATQYVSVNGGAPTTVNASIFNALPATKFVEVEVQGGGGGGGGALATGANTVAVSGSGGAGSYAKARLSSGFSSVAVTVGPAGLGGAAGQNAGTNGGTSSFGAQVSAPGGVAGQSSAAAAPPVSRGGSTPASPPAGGNLEAAIGGSGGGTLASSGNTGISAHGASSKFGCGGVNGAPACGPGAGGGGNGQVFNAPAIAGGDGGPGIVIVREYS